MFPNEWWTLTPEEYAEVLQALKALAAKDLEAGTKDVSSSKFVIHAE